MKKNLNKLQNKNSEFDIIVRKIKKLRKKIRNANDTKNIFKTLFYGYDLILSDESVGKKYLSKYLSKLHGKIKFRNPYLPIAKLCMGNKAKKTTITRYGQILYLAVHETPLKPFAEIYESDSIHALAKKGAKLIKEDHPELDSDYYYNLYVKKLKNKEAIGEVNVSEPFKSSGYKVLIYYREKGSTQGVVKKLLPKEINKKIIHEYGKYLVKKGK